VAYTSRPLSNKPTRLSEDIHGAPHSPPPFVEHVRVDHRGLDVLVAEELLDRPDVVPGQEEMGRKGVPQCVAGGVLGEACPSCGHMEGSLDRPLMDVMAAPHSGPRIKAERRRRKDELPAPFSFRVGVFPR
jgi:hypothetical protein